MPAGRITRYALPFANVIANGIATNNIVRGRTIEKFRLKLGGTAFTPAMIANYQIKANSKAILEASGADLVKVNAYRGAGTTDPGYLDAFFTDFSMNNEFDRNVGALDTLAGIETINTAVTIAGATAPTLLGILNETGAQKDTNGEMAKYAPLISKLLRWPFQASAGGKLNINLPYGKTGGSIIKRVHFISNAGLMTGITVKENSMVIHESVKAENEFEQKSNGRVPQTNMYTVDFVVDGDVRKALDTTKANSMEWIPEFSGADTGWVYVEFLDPLQNL